MVDVRVEIIDSCDLKPPQNFFVKYILKTFWCKLEIADKNLNGPSVTRLPLLLMSDYRKNMENKIGMTLFIEVWYAPTASMTQDDYSEPIFVGLSRFSLEEPLNNPNLNPVWRYLPIDKILQESIAGKLAVIISATLTTMNGHDTSAYKSSSTELERVSSYFSTQSDPPAHDCSPHLDSNKNKVQTASRAATAPLQSSKGSKCDNVNQQHQKATTTKNSVAKPPTTITNVKKSNVRKFNTALQSGQGKKSTPSPSSKPYQHVTSPFKVPAVVSHNMITSPDFPFQIPAVQAAEKRITFDLNTPAGTKTNNNYARTPNAPVNNMISPALFGYTPHTTKIRDEDLLDISNENIIPNKSWTSNTPNDKNTMNVDELLSALDDNFKHTYGNQVEKLREHNKETELTKKLIHQRDDTRRVANEHHQPKPVRPSIGHILSTMDLDTDPVRVPCSPKQNFAKTKLPPSSPPVPGMKITKYKQSTTDGSENLIDPFKSPSKRRIVANIYHDKA